MNILQQYLAECATQQDSIQKTGMSFNRNKMNGREDFTDGVLWGMSGDKSYISQVLVLNTKETDVVYLNRD